MTKIKLIFSCASEDVKLNETQGPNFKEAEAMLEMWIEKQG